MRFGEARGGSEVRIRSRLIRDCDQRAFDQQSCLGAWVTLPRSVQRRIQEGHMPLRRRLDTDGVDRCARRSRPVLPLAVDVDRRQQAGRNCSPRVRQRPSAWFSAA